MRLEGLVGGPTVSVISCSTLDDDKPSYFSKEVLLRLHQGIVCCIVKPSGHQTDSLLQYSGHNITTEVPFK